MRKNAAVLLASFLLQTGCATAHENYATGIAFVAAGFAMSATGGALLAETKINDDKLHVSSDVTVYAVLIAAGFVAALAGARGFKYNDDLQTKTSTATHP